MQLNSLKARKCYQILRDFFNVILFVFSFIDLSRGRFFLMLILISNFKYYSYQSENGINQQIVYYLENPLIRLKAIWSALYFGIVPFRYYETERHYDCSYFKHLLMNLGYAAKWILFLETFEDVQFEKRVNGTKGAK